MAGKETAPSERAELREETISGKPAAPRESRERRVHLRVLLPWIFGITRPIHPPLIFSILMRIISQSANVVLFALAGGGMIAAWEALGAMQATGRENGSAHNSLAGDGLSYISFSGDAQLPLIGTVTLSKLVALLIACALIKAVAYYLEQFSGHYVAFKALELLRGTAFSMLWPKAPGIVARSRSGELYASLTRDIDRIEVLYAHTIAPLVAGVVVPIMAVATGFILAGWETMLVPSVCALLSVCVVPFIGLRSGINSASSILHARAKLTQHTTDSVFGAREVVGYGQEDRRLKQMDHLSATVIRAGVAPAVYRGIRRGINTACIPLSVLGAVLGGMSAQLEPHMVALVAAGCLALFEAPRGLEDAAGGVDLSLASAGRLYALCHAPDPVKDGQLELGSAQGLDIRWLDVTYAYPGERRRNVLNSFNFHVPPGEHGVITGPSGSGKSTAVQLLLRYHDPDSGEIRINGRSVQDYALASLRRSVALVPQRPELLHGTIRDNLLLADPDASEEELWEALKIAHISDEIRLMPCALDEQTGTEGAGLSGGQVQRIVLARALLMHPSVLVLDEFSASLPPELDQKIRAAIQEAFPHMSIIEVTHRSKAVEKDAYVVEL